MTRFLTAAKGERIKVAERSEETWRKVTGEKGCGVKSLNPMARATRGSDYGT